MESMRSTVCYIDLDQMDTNLRLLEEEINHEADIMIVLKADGYGHGAEAVMLHFLKKGYKKFAVAALNEALALRRATKEGDILILGYTPDHLLRYAAENNITQAVFSYDQAKILSDLGLNAKIQLKVDTGMNRLGFEVNEQSADEVKKLMQLPSLSVEGVFSHLAQLNFESDERQHQKFEKFLSLCADRGVTFKCRHLCNGKSAMRHPDMRYDLVRTGTIPTGFCLGYEPKVYEKTADRFTTVMTVVSHVARVHKVPAGEGMGYDLLDPADHDRLIATLPYGYADGIPKALSNHNGWVGINGVKCEYTGNFCMDMCMCDVTNVPDVKAGDRVDVYGGAGMDYLQVREASGIGLSNLQIDVNKRVPRIYIENGKEAIIDDFLLKENK